MRGLIAACAVALALSACGSQKSEVASADQDGDQWSRGVWLYGQHCAGCHGENGEGDDETPPLAGAGALPESPRPGSDRTASFATAADVFGYVSQEMPPLAPGSLAHDEYWAILAYTLKQAGISAPDPLDAESAARVKLR